MGSQVVVKQLCLPELMLLHLFSSKRNITLNILGARPQSPRVCFAGVWVKYFRSTRKSIFASASGKRRVLSYGDWKFLGDVISCEAICAPDTSWPIVEVILLQQVILAKQYTFCSSSLGKKDTIR